MSTEKQKQWWRERAKRVHADNDVVFMGDMRYECGETGVVRRSIDYDPVKEKDIQTILPLEHWENPELFDYIEWMYSEDNPFRRKAKPPKKKPKRVPHWQKRKLMQKCIDLL